MVNYDSIIVSTRVRLARNIKDIPFPSMLKAVLKAVKK